MNWSLLPTISAPMPFQMALDGLLFTSQKNISQAPILRFYVSSGFWVSTGYSFRNDSDLSKSHLIRQNPRMPVCRRITGGGCVLHGRDLVFSLVARISSDLERLGSVRTSYEKIHESVKMGLERCGLDTGCYSRNDDLPKGSDCFDFPVESDLSWSGKKIAGGAQKRSEGVLLHHESILIPPGIVWEELIRSIREGLEKVFQVRILESDMDPDVYFEAMKKEDYSR